MGDFDQDIIIGNTVSDRQENPTVNDGTGNQKFTVGNLENNLTANENVVNVKALERCFNERIDWELSNIVDTVEDRIQNATLTAIDIIVALKIKLAIWSLNAYSGRDATSVTANSERVEQIEITAHFEYVSERNNTLHMLRRNDETRNNIPDEVSELLLPGTLFDRQPHTHHKLSVFCCHCSKDKLKQKLRPRDVYR